MSCTDNKVVDIPPSVDADTLSSCGCGQEVPIENPGENTGNPSPEPPLPQTNKSLPAPAFSVRRSDTPIVGDNLPYGTYLLLQVDSLPAYSYFEYSWDGGKHWIKGDSIMLCQSGTVSARIHSSNTVSQTVKTSFTLYYKRVLIVGNSITGHGPAPEIGWYGDWGMAASKPDSDYVHILSLDLKSRYNASQIKTLYGVPFEQNYKTYDFSQLGESIGFRPDLIIMRIAENGNTTDGKVFKEKYDRLIKTLRSDTNAKVICTTSFWPGRESLVEDIKAVAATNRYDLVDIGSFFYDKTYTAAGLFKDAGVANHPGDKGMRAIYQSIASKL
ncbi:SGNH/GDSL hydrolase family protein [Salmonirosea aquatica]|uniref:SGNH/GDSL hydrolase family protein n=1 Tax=Salmonirosea aquatica TaxID=2654236 RepID=A0A7C9BGV2_9BACT|nr:hypothetical protein [Cytophagaceae bacterium SJW1-29]